MAVMLPGEVSHLLNMLGFEWPEVNEDSMFQWGGRWQGFMGEVGGVHQGAFAGANQALTSNKDAGMDAFKQRFGQGQDSVQGVVKDLAPASGVVGGGLFVIAGLVVALKVLVVIQLVQLAIEIASAIAAAIPSAGTSLTLIPLFKIAARLAITFAINFCIEKLLSG